MIRYVETVFRRASKKPGAPAGGRTNADHTPTGWARLFSDRSGEGRTWISQRTVTWSTDRGFIEASAWGSVRPLIGPGARDSNVEESIYRRGASTPSTPTGGTGVETHTPSGWSRNSGLTPTATQNVYRSTRTVYYSTIRNEEDEDVGEEFTGATNWSTPTLHRAKTGTAPTPTAPTPTAPTPTAPTPTAPTPTAPTPTAPTPTAPTPTPTATASTPSASISVSPTRLSSGGGSVRVSYSTSGGHRNGSWNVYSGSTIVESGNGPGSGSLTETIHATTKFTIRFRDGTPVRTVVDTATCTVASTPTPTPGPTPTPTSTHRLYLGSDRVRRLYLGSARCSRVYLGAVRVL